VDLIFYYGKNCYLLFNSKKYQIIYKNIKINNRLDTTGEKEKSTSKKNVNGRSTRGHDNKKFRIRSMEKEKNGIWFPEDGGRF